MYVNLQGNLIVADILEPHTVSGEHKLHELRELLNSVI